MLAKIMKENNKNFDIIHHLTFGMTKNVPPAYKFNLPFIWGPIGGGDLIPFSFLKTMNFEAIITELFYSLFHKYSNISPWSYFTRKKVSAIIFRTNSSLEKIPENGCKNRFLISETAMLNSIEEIDSKKISDGLNLICVGRIMHGKGYIYALKGFHQFLDAGGIGKLVFLGQGPEEKTLKNYVHKHNLKDFVEFKGFVTNKTVQTELLKNHILLHPSFREGGSWAIMEAMSYGLPVICFNASGPKDMVTDKCGLLINMITPKQVVEDIKKGLVQILNDTKLYDVLSKNAHNRIKTEYTWGKRGKQMKKVYDSIFDN